MDLPAQLEQLTPAWKEIQAQLQRAVGQSTYEIWLAQLQPKGYDGDEFTVSAPVATRAWVAKRFGRVLEECVRGVVGPGARVVFDGLDNSAARTQLVRDVAARQPRGSVLNPRYRFDQFIIGAGNRLAHGAALAVAELPGQAYNPLFLHAPPGLGKTHLLHAIGNYILDFGGGTSVRYTTVEAFTNHFIGSLGSRSLEQFKRAYRDADVLLIDDVQFLASKAKTSEEFFHTFNALHESGRQLVLTCDRLPQQLRDIEERLRERFESGLVADIKPPDFATRVAILRKRAALDHVQLADATVLELIAERIVDNVRALEGALIRIVAHHSLTGLPIDLELANTILEGLYPHRKPATTPPTVASIQEVVAAHFEVSVPELLSASRAARVAWPRQVGIYLCRKLTDASLSDIGSAFGGRNHGTVLHACNRVLERTATEQELAEDVNSVADLLTHTRRDRIC